MYYKNIFTRFLFRKNFFKRVKMRFNNEKRKVSKNEYDDFVFLYKKLNKSPKVIFDCGANIGFVTYQFNKRFKNASIYSFEPNPSVFSKLKSSNLNNQNVYVHNMGIGEENGSLNFFKNNNTGTSSFLEPNDFHKAHLARKYEKIEVPIVSISDFCKMNKIENIDILKLDIEGFELKALKGCENMLENNQIDFIFAEVNLIPTYKDQCLIEDIIVYLRELNYIPYNFYGNNETILRESIITNMLFISSNIAKELNKKYGNNMVYTS